MNIPQFACAFSCKFLVFAFMTIADINILVHIFHIHQFLFLLDKCKEENLLNQSVAVSLVS